MTQNSNLDLQCWASNNWSESSMTSCTKISSGLSKPDFQKMKGSASVWKNLRKSKRELIPEVHLTSKWMRPYSCSVHIDVFCATNYVPKSSNHKK